MRFGPVPVGEAEGAIAAHSVREGGLRIKKGRVLTAADIAALREAGRETIVVARLEPGDLGEDAAASRIAAALAGPGIRVDPPFTGRANLFAETGGLLVVDRAAIDALNRLDPGITVATLAEFAPAEPGRMVATVKIIPFAVSESAVARAEAAAPGALRLAPWRPLRVGLVATTLPGLKPSTMDKTRRVLEERLRPAGATLVSETRVAHDEAALAAAIDAALELIRTPPHDLPGSIVADPVAQSRLIPGGDKSGLLIVFGASAITDIDDVIPAAIRAAGGEVEHFGMPVDPGNLLLLGRIGDVPVLGAPGCARSPVENGFDWVLNRLLAGLEVSPEAITGMGVGGLLMEIVTRPQPRLPVGEDGEGVAVLLLAAGRSRRMEGPNKLLATFDGVKLVRRMASVALAAPGIGPVVVVTGHMEPEIRAALAGLPVEFAHNPDFAEGLSTSLKRGLSAVPPAAAGVLVMLADMPRVDARLLAAMLDAFRARNGPAIVMATHEGKRGNPVLFSREFLPELALAQGDSGARHVIDRHPEAVVTVEAGAAASLDVDTVEAMREAGGVVTS